MVEKRLEKWHIFHELKVEHLQVGVGKENNIPIHKSPTFNAYFKLNMSIM